MPGPQVPRAATSVVVLIGLAADHGVGPEQCLRGTGLDLATLYDPVTEISRAQELAVIRNLVDALGHLPGLGLRAGTLYHLTTYGIWGFALATCPTLRDAVELGLRYVDLTFAFTQVRAGQESGRACFVLEADDDVPPDLARFTVERDAAAIVTILRELVARPVPLSSVSFRFPEPDDPAPYVETFRLRPAFGRAVTCLEVDAALLDLPLPQANEPAALLCAQQCEALLARRRWGGGVAGRVRRHVLGSLGNTSMERTAAALHVGVRTLRRLLEAEGTCYRELVDEVREGLAEELLLAGLTLDEVAARLGYAEAASLARAFVRWKGCPPGRWASSRTRGGPSRSARRRARSAVRENPQSASSRSP